MDENKKDKIEGNDQPAIKIDYDNIDVVDIMNQIRQNIASQARDEEAAGPCLANEEDRSRSEEPAKVSIEPDITYAPIPVSRAKRILLTLMRPFAPVIKLLVLPVHHEMMETINKLDYTNKRLDSLSDKMEKTLTQLSQEMYDSFHKTNLKIDSFNDSVNRRMDKTFHDFGKTLDRAREYTKLLHNLSHNIVVELTKLKVEEESLKIKNRIMEKDFEHLRQKEKAIEKQVFK